jgi:hypothetical protein
MTNEHIKILAEDGQMARSALRYLLENPENVKKLDELSRMDIKYARFCERKGIPTTSNWRELAKQECRIKI